MTGMNDNPSIDAAFAAKGAGMKRVFVFAGSVALIPMAFAQPGGMKGMDMKGMDMKDMDMKMERKSAKGTAHKASGTVTKVDPGKGALTVAHGPVSSMSWPAMTMTFMAKDKALLEKLSPGMKIEFEFVQQGGDYMITSVK